MTNAENLRNELMSAIAAAGSTDALEAVRLQALGKKGSITQLMKTLGGMDPDARREAGQAINTLKSDVAGAIDARKADLEGGELDIRLMAEKIDVTLPERPQDDGRVHPISQVIDEMTAIFCEMGFSVAEGPDIEEDWYNFTALNIPPEHPARQEHDTFYLPGEKDGHRKVLRTHTSPVQIHTMQDKEPPIRIVVPGRTYRCDYDATHSPMFHQVEGLVIDETTHMGHLKGCLIDFCRAMFQVDDLPVRFRPSYFPFTEPSAEVDIGCTREGGEFRIGHGDDWLEILGCGMVNPKVLENCGIDSSKYQGFAFGMGVERIAMLKYGIPDLRTFFESDLRWLRHYGFSALDVPDMTGGLNR
ncbi:MAG: phenylalanine--tRNA ligase subunit alpha [Rhodospirillales bacterium]|nr:phenylalanine--tRNA ligase subunit alpha [Rhodospirillales bacterium]